MKETNAMTNSFSEDATTSIDSGVTREEMHLRRIAFRGFRRSDGLLEVQAQLTDQKTHDFEPFSGGKHVVAGDAIHDHGLHVVFDSDMVIREVSTAIRAHPYPECAGGGETLQAMVGVRIGRGWSSEVRNRLPSDDTCTHIKEMLIPLASAAYQTIYSVRSGHADNSDAIDANGRPRKIDSCYAYSAKRGIVERHWPMFYMPSAAVRDEKPPEVKVDPEADSSTSPGSSMEAQ
jgi:hypothetical protein